MQIRSDAENRDFQCYQSCSFCRQEQINRHLVETSTYVSKSVPTSPFIVIHNIPTWVKTDTLVRDTVSIFRTSLPQNQVLMTLFPWLYMSIFVLNKTIGLWKPQINTKF